MDRVTARVSYLSDLAYCFSDGVKLRTMQRVKERFGIELTDEDMDVILTYARDTRIPTVNYRNYKNAADLAKFAKWTTEHWKYYPNTSGDILTVDKLYLDDNPELWMILGQRTADNTGIYKGYLWLNQTTGDIELTEGNTQKGKGYSTVVEILKQAEETYPTEDIEWVRCPGLGVINETTGVIGIQTEEGVITANEDGLKELKFREKEWTKAFLYSEIGGQRFEFYDPEPEYGAYKTIEIGRDNAYIGVEYVID